MTYSDGETIGGFQNCMYLHTDFDCNLFPKNVWLIILKSYTKKIKLFFDQWWLKLLCLGLNAQPEIRIFIGLYLSCIFRLLFKLKFLSQNLHVNASPV